MSGGWKEAKDVTLIFSIVTFLHYTIFVVESVILCVVTFYFWNLGAHLYDGDTGTSLTVTKIKFEKYI